LSEHRLHIIGTVAQFTPVYPPLKESPTNKIALRPYKGEEKETNHPLSKKISRREHIFLITGKIFCSKNSPEVFIFSACRSGVPIIF